MSHDAHVVMLLPGVIKQISMVGNLDGTSEYFALSSMSARKDWSGELQLPGDMMSVVQAVL